MERAVGPGASMTDDNEPKSDGKFKTNLVRVMAVQIVTLVLLWLLQQHFSS